MRLRALALVGALLWTSPAFSQNSDTAGRTGRGFSVGNKLYSRCSSPNNSLEHVYCLGYVAGATDSLQMDGHICVPDNVTVAQAVDVVMKYLRDHPEDRHFLAPSLADLALRQAFPCKEQAH